MYLYWLVVFVISVEIFWLFAQGPKVLWYKFPKSESKSNPEGHYQRLNV